MIHIKCFRISWELIIFFVLLAALTILGDGKQPAVDIVAVAGILSLFVVRQIRNKQTKFFSGATEKAWLVVLLYFIIRTIFSDSIGYSISSSVRWIMAYVVFMFFSSFDAEKKHDRTFSVLLLAYSVCAVVAFFIVTLFEELGRALPGTNLLYPTYGHSQVANVIVFVFPLALYRLLREKKWSNIFLVLFFSGALIFSFARGAWILMMGYLSYVLFTRRQLSSKIKWLGVGGLITVGILFIVLAVFPKSFSKNIAGVPLFHRQIVKYGFVTNRIRYMGQAVQSIQQQPLFGFGPGTFFLLSKRFQETQKSYSWYAHSFPLELGAEVGIVGLLLICGLGLLLRKAIVLSKEASLLRGLRDGIVLTLIYSCYEINLNFLVIWLLVWASVGLLYGKNAKDNKASPSPLFSISLVMLILFYLSTALAALFSLFPQTKNTTTFLEPHNVGLVVERLSGANNIDQISLPEQKLISTFHKNDPEILEAFAKLYKLTDVPRAQEYYKLATHLDPHNTEYYKAYFKLLSSLRQTEVLGEQILSLSKTALSKRYHKQIDELTPFAHMFGEYYMNWMDKENPSFMHDYAGLFYRFGIADLRDVELTEKLLVLARDIYPDLGVLHVELAAYYSLIKNDKQKARDVLVSCQLYRSPAKQCKQQLLLPFKKLSEYKEIVW